MALKSSFPPVVDGSTRLLLLGSLPGEVSLARSQYYAHPQNQFWRLLETVIDEPLASLNYEDRLVALRRSAIGLWDVVGAARREGSLDGAIREVKPNVLGDLLRTLPALEAIAFNGVKAAEIGSRQLSMDAAPIVLRLPSSSPAHTLAFARKAEVWAALRRFTKAAARG